MEKQSSTSTAWALWLVAIAVTVYAASTLMAATEWWQLATGLIAVAGAVVLVICGARLLRRKEE